MLAVQVQLLHNDTHIGAVVNGEKYDFCLREKGAIEIASRYNLNDYVSSMITGIILFFILGSEFFINYKVKFRGSKEEAK